MFDKFIRMKQIKLVKLSLTIVLTLSIYVGCYAQETIMNDISYPFMEKLITLAKQNNPQAKITQEQIKIAKTALTQAKFSWLDGISFSYSYNPSTIISAVSPDLFLGFQSGISISLGTIFKNPLLVRSARENIVIAEYEQDVYNSTLENEVKTRYFTYLQNLATLRLRIKSAQDAMALLNEAKHQFEKGAETLDTYTSASASFTENSQAKINAEVAVIISKFAIEELIGKKLEEVK